MNKTRESRGKWFLVLAFGLTVVTTFCCAYDGVIAHREEAPDFLFSLLLPYLQAEYLGGGRFVSLAASLALPGLSLLLPAVTIGLGLKLRRRWTEEGSAWGKVAAWLVAFSFLCFLLSLYSCGMLYRVYCAV
ncbi:MAG TPA: hypothetical protein EYP85_05845 [Armatimonadetes bacterium]|nr:hypothetical protein [Armatimonadota bacterium]